MYRYSVDNAITYTSEDFVLFRESPFACWMERLTLENPDHGIPSDIGSTPPRNSMERQDDIAETLREEGKDVSLIDWDVDESVRRGSTLNAMRDGADFIINGQLALGPLSGSANLLMRTSGYSELGNFLYIPCDTQAITTLHSAFRLCFLADLLHSLQGQLPPQMLIIRSGDDLLPLQTEDHIYHYRAVKHLFMAAMRDFRKHRMPDPAESSHFGRWSDCAHEVLKQRVLREEAQALQQAQESLQARNPEQSQEPVEEQAVGEQTAPQQTALEQAVLEQAVSQQTVSEQAVSEQVAPEQTAPEQVASERAAPEQREPEQAAPAQVPLEQAASEQAMPQQAASEQAMPQQAASEVALEETVYDMPLQQAVGSSARASSLYDLDDTARTAGSAQSRATAAQGLAEVSRRGPGAFTSGGRPKGPTLVEQARMLAPGTYTPGPGSFRFPPIVREAANASEAIKPRHNRRASDAALENLEFVGSSSQPPRIGAESAPAPELSPVAGTAPAPNLRHSRPAQAPAGDPPPASSYDPLPAYPPSADEPVVTDDDEPSRRPFHAEPAAETSHASAVVRSVVDMDSNHPVSPAAVLTTADSEFSFEGGGDINRTREELERFVEQNWPAEHRPEPHSPQDQKIALPPRIFSDSLITSDDFDA